MNTEKLEPFSSPDSIFIGSLILRPFGAGSIALMSKVGNRLMDSSVNDLKDLEKLFHVQSFIFLHGEELEKVKAATLLNENEFLWAVSEFCNQFSGKQITDAVGPIMKQITKSMVGQDYEVEKESHDPN
jgi:hypothetical protein